MFFPKLHSLQELNKDLLFRLLLLLLFDFVVSFIFLHFISSFSTFASSFSSL